MKRDMELVRLLLLRTESGGQYVTEAEQYDVPTRAYHVLIMREAGLIDAIVQNDSNGLPASAVIKRLTWRGHEFLDAARSDAVWQKAREKFFKTTARPHQIVR